MRGRDKTTIKSIEEGRADFAYKCVKQVINMGGYISCPLNSKLFKFITCFTHL